MQSKVKLLLVLAFAVFFASSLSVNVLAKIRVVADQDKEITVLGVDIEPLIAIGSSILAILLFAISAVAYKRERRSRLSFVMAAFLVFAVKGTLIAIDSLYPGQIVTEPLAYVLDFVVLILFFAGLVKK